MNIYLLVLPEDGLLWYIGRGHQPSLPHPLPGRRWCCRLLQCLLHPGSFSPSCFSFSFRLLYLEICILVLLVTILTYFLRSWQRWCVPVATLCRCLWIIPYIWDWPSWSWSVLSEYSSFLGYAVHFFWAPDLLGPFSLESLWTGFLSSPKASIMAWSDTNTNLCFQVWEDGGGGKVVLRDQRHLWHPYRRVHALRWHCFLLSIFKISQIGKWLTFRWHGRLDCSLCFRLRCLWLRDVPNRPRAFGIES